MSYKNIFQIWRDNGEKLPIKVRRCNWSSAFYTVVERIEIGNWPYGKAYGYPTIEGERTDHYNYDKQWCDQGIIPCCGCYQWSLVE